MRSMPRKRARISLAIIGLVLTQSVIAGTSPQGNPPAGTVTQGGGYSIPWHTIDSGGTVSAAGGGWALAGTVGQFDATPDKALEAGAWSITGGFWAAPFELHGGDGIFRDRFEDQ